MGKMSFHSDIEIFNKEFDERYQIDKGDQLDKKSANAKEGLTGSNEVLKLGIMSSQSCIKNILMKEIRDMIMIR